MARNRSSATAYVDIIPRIKGISKELSKKLNSSFSSNMGANIGQKIGNDINTGLSSSIKSASSGMKSLGTGIGQSLSSSITNGIKSAASSAVNLAKSSIKQIGSLSVQSTKAVVTTGAATLAAASGYAFSKGWSRAVTMNEAKAKLAGLGIEGKRLEKVMKSARDSVQGFDFSTGESAGAAGVLLASGVKEGKELDKVLSTIARTATLTGSEFGEIANIFGKGAASGVVQGDILAQLQERKLAVIPALSKQLGIAQGEVKKLASEGKISFKDFTEALADLGQNADKVAALSWKGTLKNLGSAIGRITEPFHNIIIEGLLEPLNGMKDYFGGIADEVAESGTWNKLADEIIGAITRAFDFIKGIDIGGFINKISGFVDIIKKFKDLTPIILGFTAGFSGGLLSDIPVVGKLFSSFSGPVGIFVGGLIQAYNASEPLQNSIKNLMNTIGGLFKGIDQDKTSNGLSEMFQKIGDSLATAVNWINSTIASFVEGGGIEKITGWVTQAGTFLSGAISKIFDSFKNSEGLAGGNDLLSTLLTLGEKIGGAILKIAGTVIEFIQSDTFMKMLNFVGEIADWLGNNSEAALKILGGIALVTVLGKFLTAFSKISGTGSAIGSIGGKIIDGLVSLGKSLAKGITSLSSSLLTLPAALPGILAGIASVTAIAVAIVAGIGIIAGTFKLLEAIGIGNPIQEIIRVLGEGITEIANIAAQVVTTLLPILQNIAIVLIDTFKYLWESIFSVITSYGPQLIEMFASLTQALLPVLELFIQHIRNVFTGVAEVITAVAFAIGEALSGVSNVFDSFFGGIADVIPFLAENGVAAGAGALALAAGLTAIAGAMAAGGLSSAFTGITEGIGAAAKGIGNRIAGNKKQEESTGMFEQITRLVEGLNTLATTSVNIIENLSTIAAQAYTKAFQVIMQMNAGFTAGFLVLQVSLTSQMLVLSNTIANSFSQAFMAQQSAMTSSVINTLSMVLTSAQQYLDSRVLQVRTSSSGVYGNGGGFANNRNTPNNSTSKVINNNFTKVDPAQAAEIINRQSK